MDKDDSAISLYELAALIESMKRFGHGLTSTIPNENANKCKEAVRYLEKYQRSIQEDRENSRWRTIESAPTDGTEILGVDEEGNLALIAWCSNPADNIHEQRDPQDPGWFLRACGTWELYDGFALQSFYPERYQLIQR